MKLDAQLINHNFVIRMVIFAVFLFKNYRKEELIYSQMINNFLKKKISLKINLTIECGPKLAIKDSRDILIENILNEEDFDHMNLVVATFKTGLKEVSMQIDLNREEKYENYLYS